MSDIRDLYLETAAAAIDAFDDPAVAAAWNEPSVLDGMPVGALVAHTARALSTVRHYLGGEPPAYGDELVDAPGYVLAALPGGEEDQDVDRAVLGRAVDAAADGHLAVTRDAHDDLRALRGTLPHLSRDHILVVLDGIGLRLDEYLETRVVELVVHHDDLDVSVEGAPRRPLPDEAGAVAVGLLAEVARRRTSTQAMIVALARHERLDGDPPRAL